MKIKIDTVNNEAITAALDKVNGKASSYTITCTEELIDIANRAEKKLEVLPKAMRKGAEVKYRPAGPGANAYKYSAKTTSITIQRGASGWFLAGVVSAKAHPKSPELFAVAITEAQAEEIKARAIAPFSVNR
jgi:predicted ATP-grasp superfamily ATP-dependent carboligase